MGTGARPPLSRDVIVAEARSIIVDEGLDAVSLRHLAERLGVTASALYAHVEDKDDLLRSVTAREIDALLARFTPRQADPVLTLREFCRTYLRWATANAALYRTMFRYPPWGRGADGDYAPGEPGLPLAGPRFAVPHAAVAEAVRTGRFRPQRPLLALLTIWTAMHGLAEVLLLGLPTDESEREAFTAHMIDTVIRGLEVPAGPGGADGEPTLPS
jgi:AcrR family transcriptional regulator